MYTNEAIKDDLLFKQFIFIVSLLPLASALRAESKFELGVGTLAIHLNHYRGSDQSREFYFPFPYFNYQTDRIEADSSRVRGTIFSNRFVGMTFSFMAGLRVESDENIARQGMPELLSTFEIGVMPILYIVKASTFILQFDFPTRRVFETNLDFTKGIGTQTSAYITAIFKSSDLQDWTSTLTYGYLFGDRDLHSYYYTVESDYATTDRPGYRAAGGFAGNSFAFNVKKRFGNFIFMPFLRYDTLDNAVFEESPLVKKKNYLMAGTVLSFLFF